MERSTQGRLNRRRFLQMLAGTGGAALLAACGGAPAAPSADGSTTAPSGDSVATSAPAAASSAQTTVVMMHARNEFSEDQQKQFETENPNIAIEFIEYDATKLFASASAGNPPDLIRVQAPDIPQMLARGMLLDLTPYFNTSTVIKVDDLAPANKYYRASGPTDIGSGNIYGMAKDWSPDFTLFAYKKAFTEADVPLPSQTNPMTYAELADVASRLTKLDGDRTTRWGFAYSNEWTDRIMMNMLAEKNQMLYSEDFGQLNLTNNDDARAMAKYFFDLSKANHSPNPLNPSPTWIGEDFTKGTIGLIQYGYWFSAMAESDITKGEVVMLPAPTWSGTRLDPTVTATGMVISKNTKNADAAWKVFEWFNAGTPSVERAGSGWGVPALVSQYSLLPTQDPFQKQANTVLQDELKYAVNPLQFNPYLGGDTFVQVWSKNLEAALRGQLTFDQMLQSVEKEVNQAIQDGKDKIV